MLKRANFLFIEKDNEVYTLNMTPELQNDIGTVGFAEFVDITTVDAEDPIVNLEASKTIVEITSPLSGRIIERNDKIIKDPSILNSTSKEDNWIVKLTNVDENEFNTLNDA